jgi:hypothetical protein
LEEEHLKAEKAAVENAAASAKAQLEEEHLKAEKAAALEKLKAENAAALAKLKTENAAASAKARLEEEHLRRLADDIWKESGVEEREVGFFVFLDLGRKNRRLSTGFICKI